MKLKPGLGEPLTMRVHGWSRRASAATQARRIKFKSEDINMMFTNDTTKSQAIQQTVGELFKNRAEYFQLTELLRKQTGIEVDDGYLQSEIDCEHSGKLEASAEDAVSIMKFIQK